MAGLRATNEMSLMDTQDDKNREFGIGSSERESEAKVYLIITKSIFKIRLHHRASRIT